MTNNAFGDLLTIATRLHEAKAANPAMNKADIERLFAQLTATRKQRSVFACPGFAFRFSEANKGSFSNVVLSLSALHSYDDNPFVVCVVRPRSLDFLLANTTFFEAHQSQLAPSHGG